jgi:hypothetical protein
MHYTNIGRSQGRKEIWFFKTITVYQGRNTGKIIVKIQNIAEKGAETQNTTGGRQHAAENKGTQGALPHS